MRLIDLLDRSRVLVPLRAKDLAAAAGKLADTMITSGVAVDAVKLKEIVPGTLPREVPTVGQAFLLHFRSEVVTKPGAALGVTPTPVRRHPEGTHEARIVILLLSPPKETSAHLRAVSAFARALSRREVVDALLAARSPAEVMAAAPLADLELPGYLTVRDVMVPRRLSVRLETPLGEAARLMVEHSVAALPVVSEADEVLGMVTHQELLRHLLPTYVKRESTGEFRAVPRRGRQLADPHAIPVREVMDRSVLCVTEDQTLAEVASMMLKRDIERCPVVREGALVGFLTRGDIVRRLFGR